MPSQHYCVVLAGEAASAISLLAIYACCSTITPENMPETHQNAGRLVSCTRNIIQRDMHLVRFFYRVNGVSAWSITLKSRIPFEPASTTDAFIAPIYAKPKSVTRCLREGTSIEALRGRLRRLRRDPLTSREEVVAAAASSAPFRSRELRQPVHFILAGTTRAHFFIQKKNN